jgi:hypothetical protein
MRHLFFLDTHGLWVSFTSQPGTIAFVLSTLYSSWIVSLLGLWFIVPFGLPVIGIVHAFGLVTFVAMFKNYPDNDNSFWESLLKGIVLSTVIFAFGGIAFWLM